MKKRLVLVAMLFVALTGFTVVEDRGKEKDIQIEKTTQDTFIGTKKAYCFYCDDDAPKSITFDVYRRGEYDFYAQIGNRNYTIERVTDGNYNASVSYGGNYYLFNISWY
ncbi:MAG: hypothetical protein IJ180_02510 [Bacteroidales bacterium]|nr:hypothetical protein [Bacteroidales bacterium]